MSAWHAWYVLVIASAFGNAFLAGLNFGQHEYGWGVVGLLAMLAGAAAAWPWEGE